MATITTHRDQDVVEHRLGSVVPLLASLLVLAGLVLGLAWVASQIVDVAGWAFAAH
jgi:ABC-type uncharacterized transport system permease subunit